MNVNQMRTIEFPIQILYLLLKVTMKIKTNNAENYEKNLVDLPIRIVRLAAALRHATTRFFLKKRNLK